MLDKPDPGGAPWHPPLFHPSHRLSQWPSCTLEAHCPGCGRVSVSPVRLLIERHRDMGVGAAARVLRCGACRMPARPVFLVAGHHRDPCGGPDPDWAGLVVR